MEEFLPLLEESYRRLDRLSPQPEPTPDPGREFRHPDPGDNPFNAWIVRSTIDGSSQGPLAGKSAAVKDNISVAGLPLTMGSTLLEEYVPSRDATVVNRLLQAGVTIMGKSVSEDHAASSGSHTATTGPVQNPRRPGYSAGGSSSGSAALVGGDEVDIALGTDTAGSVRTPAAYCGVFGHKPTFGLIPLRGIVAQEPSMDHVGLLARTVDDISRTLEALSGADESAPESSPFRTYTHDSRSLEQGVEDLRIGIVEEGFDWPYSEPESDRTVRNACLELEDDGAKIKPVSIPEHRDALAVWSGVINEGMASLILHQNGIQFHRNGLYSPDFAEHYGDSLEKNADELPVHLKMLLLVGEHARRNHHSTYYARAQNLRQALTEAYDELLSSYDLLAMPTSPMKSRPLPGEDPDPSTVIREALAGQISNTCAFNLTGHPAINVPCGSVDDLPIGLMLIGAMGDDRTVLRASRSFERFA